MRSITLAATLLIATSATIAEPISESPGLKNLQLFTMTCLNSWPDQKKLALALDVLQAQRKPKEMLDKFSGQGFPITAGWTITYEGQMYPLAINTAGCSLLTEDIDPWLVNGYLRKKLGAGKPTIDKISQTQRAAFFSTEGSPLLPPGVIILRYEENYPEEGKAGAIGFITSNKLKSLKNLMQQP